MRTRKRILWIGLVVIVLVAAAVGFLYIAKPETQPSSQQSPVVPAISSTQKESDREVPTGAREYRSEKYGFSVLYPESLAVREYNEGGGAITIAFQNTSAVQGFQIFIVPYAKDQVDEARFKKDIPSGVRKNVKEVTIDGALGASFYSMNELLGETAEVWFVKSGYLYEVTTPRPLQQLLDQVLATWEFI